MQDDYDGSYWYRIYDRQVKKHYYLPTYSLRIVPDEELAPISPNVAPDDKHIFVDLTSQTMVAYEGDTPVHHLLEILGREIGQRSVAAGVRSGTTGPRHWAGTQRLVDAFDAKADALAVLSACNAPINVLSVSPHWMSDCCTSNDRIRSS